MRVPEIALGALLSVAVFALGVLFSTQPPIYDAQRDKAGKYADNEAAKIAIDERLARYTWWLAVLTGGLVVVAVGQGYFLLRADRTARIAANAANLSAKAAVGQKLPIIRCRTPHLWPAQNAAQIQNFAGTGDPTRNDFIKVIDLGFFNFGETLAYPQECGLGWMLTEAPNAVPTEPIYTTVRPLNSELVFKDEFETSRIVDFVLILDDKTKRNIASGTTALRLCAYLKYLDFFG